MRSCLEPSYSEWKPSTSLLYTIAEARKDLGLFDDTTFDTKLTALITTAQEYASNIVDGPISSTERVDYYPCLGAVHGVVVETGLQPVSCSRVAG